MKKGNKLVFIILCIYIIVVPILPYGLSLSFIPIIHKLPSSGDLTLVILFIAFSLHFVKNIKNKSMFIKDFVFDKIGISFLVLFLIMLLSTIYATVKSIALSESARFLSFIILYFIVKYSVNKEKAKTLIKCYFFSFTLINIYGIFQKITGYGELKGYSMITSSALRTNANFDNPNTFAAFLIIGALPALMMIIYSKKLYEKAFFVCLFLMTIANIDFSGSRSSYIGLVIGGLVVSLLYSYYFLIGVGGIGLIALLIPQLRGRVLAIFNMNLNISRIQIWRTALKMIQEHPILGVGNGNFIELYDTYVNKYKYLRYLNYSHYPSHNSFLKIESELGIVGGISFLSILINGVLNLKKVIRVVEDKYINLFYIGFLASAVGFIFMNLIDNLFFLPEVVAFFWIFLAVADGLLYDDTKVR